MYQTITNEKRFNVVYMITNKLDGKSYIGSALDFVQRQYEHLSDLNRKVHHNIYFQRAWYKYGSENFIFEIVDQVDDPEKLVECEQWWIDSFDFNWLYNILPTAYSWLGGKHTEESKRKMSISRTGKKNHFYGKKHTKKSRDKMSQSRTGKPGHTKGKHLSKEHREKLAEINRGKRLSEETKAKISLAVAGKNNPMFGVSHTEESIQKMRDNRTDKKAVVQINIDTDEIIAVFNSVSQAARETGIVRPGISNVCNNSHKQKTSGGFKWKFVKDLE